MYLYLYLHTELGDKRSIRERERCEVELNLQIHEDKNNRFCPVDKRERRNVEPTCK